MEAKTRSTILVVDDMAANIEILNGILCCDNDVLFATNGKEALVIAAEQVPDLVLLDVMMPDMDGYQVCQKLKAGEKTRDIPVIFVTANDQEDDESRGFEAGVVDYIIKPVRPAIVRARVKIHLELKRYRDELKTLSTVDGLTGIANRRRFDEALENEFRRARRNHSPLSIIMLDIDFFKAYNDNYGHQAGDECLKKLAAGIAGTCCRPADLFARFGGEEFVMLLPDTDAPGAYWVARQVQAKVKMLNIPHAYSRVAELVTFSIGISTGVPGDILNKSYLINAADDLLYAAKRNGRNQIKAEGKQAVKV